MAPTYPAFPIHVYDYFSDENVVLVPGKPLPAFAWLNFLEIPIVCVQSELLMKFG